jgi:protein involved in polysaccharide export with SLBB domain
MKYLLFLLIAFALMGCITTSDPSAQMTQADQPAVYRLEAGDKVNIIVFGESDMSGISVVDSAGKVAVPLLGKVTVADLTETEAAASIATTLKKEGFLRQPHVTLEVQEMRPVFITGEVEQAGKYPYQSNLTVYQAVAMAGGFTYRADRDDISIRRSGNKQILSAVEDTLVLPGDVIEIGERFF